MTANRPQPRPGVLSIEAYVPGKSSAPGVAKVFKLSANETPLGPSPKAVEAYLRVASHLHDYPDGTARAMREAIGRTYGLDPARIICGAGSDDLLNLLARAYLADGDRGDLHAARIFGLSDRHARHRRQAGGRCGNEFHRGCRRDPRTGDAADQDGLHRQSEQSDRHLHAVRRGETPASRIAPAGLARDRCRLCRIRATQRLRVQASSLSRRTRMS